MMGNPGKAGNARCPLFPEPHVLAVKTKGAVGPLLKIIIFRYLRKPSFSIRAR